MSRLMLDTCVVVDMLIDFDGLDKSVVDMLEDPENILVASFETMRELVVLFNNKNLLSKQWKTAEDVIRTVEEDLDVEFLPLRPRVGYTYANLHLNEGQGHKAPSDHVIISQAITEHLTLISSDTRFWFYRNQGLDLIEY